ncbi:hypothetical protein BAAA27672_08370 [Bifidobacterium animalis subsp. animalis ATCC 27672]|nr:hypothetical protein BAAA27672_08370 [Bifidobacterium animalis subsp. animalis ATCC 27672]
MKKRRIGIALTLLGIMGLAVPAQAAEGTFTSFLTGVVTDFRSRNWSDKNLTADATTIRMENCVIQSGLTNASATMGVQLRQDRSLQPDRDAGTRSFPCGRPSGNTSTQSWGRQTAGNYFFKITWTPSNDRTNVQRVIVTW